MLDNFFLKCNVNAEVYQQVLEYFMLPSGEEIFGCADFMFHQDLVPAQCQLNNEVARRPWH